MSDTDATARPRQLTMAAWFVTGGSVMLVLLAFDRLTRLRSVETRDAVSTGLSAAKDLGVRVGLDGALDLLRIGLFVAAVCAAVAAVLGVFVLQKHHAARLGLGVLAVPLLLTAPLTGGFVGAMVTAAIVTLWGGPARDWFAGRPVRQTPGLFDRTPSDASRDQRPPAPLPVARPEQPAEHDRRPDLSTGATSTAPRPSQGYGAGPVRAGVGAPGGPPVDQRDGAPGVQGQPPGQVSWQPQHQPQHRPQHRPQWQGGPQGQPRAGWPGAPVPDPRVVPTAVKVACALTWVFSLAFLVVLVASLTRLAGDSGGFLAEAERNQTLDRVDPDAIVPMLWAGGAMMAAWAVGAMVLAWFVWRRHDWARWLLVVSAAAVFAAGIVAFPFGIPLQVACAVTIGLLFRRQVRDWFDGGQRHQGPPVW